MKINEIVIKGSKQDIRETGSHSDSVLTARGSFLIEQATRDQAESHSVRLEEDDLIELVFEDGTTWFSGPETLSDIFPEAQPAPFRSAEPAFELPAEISYETTDRGIANKAILKLFNVFSRKKIRTNIKALAVTLEDKQLEGKTGLFRLSPDFNLVDFIPGADNQTYCLLIHGTASSVSGSFGDARKSGMLDFMVKAYGDRLLAFQHRTLTENPLQNVRDLLKALPKSCTLHLVTTSRGGLIGEVLSRFCNPQGKVKGFSKAELAFMKKEYPQDYFLALNDLVDEIKEILANKSVSVEKFIRIACPANGTTLASKRLDTYLNITLNLIGVGAGFAANPLYIAFRNLISGVIDSKNSVDDLPGLEAQNPASPFIKVINGAHAVGADSETVSIDNSLVIISGNSRPALKVSALWIIASKIFFRRKNDLVVNTDSMSMGTKRTGTVQEFFYEDQDIDHFKYFENPVTGKAILQALESPWGEKLNDFTERKIHTETFRDGIDLSQYDIEDPLAEARGKKDPKIEIVPVKVSVSQGELFFASFPVLAGHFEDDGILYGEKSINKHLNGALAYRHQLGIYPGPIGTSEVILTEGSPFKGAIIVGLGKPGNLTASQLTISIEQGVASYMLKRWHKDSMTGISSNENEIPGISSLVIGSGYAGLSIENSIKAVIQGVFNANKKVRTLKLRDVPVIEYIEFIELYEDKAVSCLFSISRIEKEEGNAFKIVREGKGIKSLLGFRKRIPSDETEAWWNRISVTKEEIEKGSEKKKEITGLKFKSSTRSSREEEQKLLTTPSLMEKLIKDISLSKKWSPERAKAIFELLIPNDFKDQLKRHGNIIWVLDEYSATYPWELLQDSLMDAKPICITSGMIRQLSTSNYNKSIKAVSKNNVLVVADPDLEGFVSQLPGARDEGKKVSEKLDKYLKDAGGKVTLSSFDKHSDILEKMFRDDYKIIHLSGHGVFNKDNPEQSGMVIGNNQFLSTREIKQMSNVPELVFVNCCHLGKTDGAAEELYQERYQLAANIGTQLINNGVRCVIAAGWAVDDRAAERFADIFYNRLFSGFTFGDAVFEARKSVYEDFNHVNTWGAYQCYGDPFYKFENKKRAYEEKEIIYLIEQEAEVDLENLLHATEFGDKSSDVYLAELRKISRAVDEAKIRNPKITELEALIYFDLREYEMACRKFRELLTMEEASFSFSAAEKYCNARAKKIIEDYNKDKANSKEFKEEINKVIDDLSILINLSPTSERYNILGSTYKRKALISEGDEKKEGYLSAAAAYQNAYITNNSWYSLTNWLILESAHVRTGSHQWEGTVKDRENLKGYKIPEVEEALKLLEKKKADLASDKQRMSYWDLLAGININLCEYILTFSDKNTGKQIDELINGIRVLWEKAGSKGKRFAEIEHLEFAINALSVEKNKNTDKLAKNLEILKENLGKLV